jgi:hypothetical protein
MSTFGSGKAQKSLKLTFLECFSANWSPFSRLSQCCAFFDDLSSSRTGRRNYSFLSPKR